jgi:hypothetical protein
MTLYFLFGCRYSLGRNCSGCPSLKFTLIHPLEFRAMTTTFESRVYYLPSKNPHTQEGWGTLSISLEIIKFDTYRDIGKKKLSVAWLLGTFKNPDSVYVSCNMCHVSHVACQVSGVTCCQLITPEIKDPWSILWVSKNRRSRTQLTCWAGEDRPAPSSQPRLAQNDSVKGSF